MRDELAAQVRNARRNDDHEEKGEIFALPVSVLYRAAEEPQSDHIEENVLNAPHVMEKAVGQKLKEVPRLLHDTGMQRKQVGEPAIIVRTCVPRGDLNRIDREHHDHQIRGERSLAADVESGLPFVVVAALIVTI